MEVRQFVPLFVVLVVAYCLVGLLLFVRRDRKQISSRSPILLLISHIGNICQSAAILVQMTPTLLDNKYEDVFESAQVLFHFLFFFPYLLRGYRLYFVFHTKIGNGEQGDKYFIVHMRRARQWWLVEVLAVIMLPVLLLCLALIIVPRLMGSQQYNSNTDLYERVYILVMFIEEMMFILCIYFLRHVEPDFSMNRELVVVCCLWYFNVLFSGHSTFVFWMYELLARNTVITCVSLGAPLVMSFRRPEMKEALTLQSLYSLKIVLENPLPYEYFEQFLRQPRHCSSEDPTHNALEIAGDAVLQLYCVCCVFKAKPSHTQAEQLLSELGEFRRQFSIMSDDIVVQVTKKLKDEGVSEEMAILAESFLFNLLETHYFPKFKNSSLFGLLCRFVEQSELRSNRIKITSLMGEESI